MAAVPDRFTEFVCEATVGGLILAVAIYGLIALFRRDQKDGPRDKPRF